MRQVKMLLTLAWLVAAGLGFAQTVTVSGIVVGDNDPATGLVDVSVALHGDISYATTTGEDGSFSISEVVPTANYTLELHFIDYNARTMAVTVGSDDLDLGTITMTAIAPPPTFMSATLSADNWLSLHWGFDYTRLQWCEDSNYDGIGTGGQVEFAYGTRWTPENLTGYGYMAVHRVRFFPRYDCSYTIRIYTGGHGNVNTGSFDPGTLAAEQTASNLTINAWNDVTLDELVPVPRNQELWIVIAVNTPGGYPAGCDEGPEFPGYSNLICWNGVWQQLTDLDASLTYNWDIIGIMTENGRNVELRSGAISASPVPNVSNTRLPVAGSGTGITRGHLPAAAHNLCNVPWNHSQATRSLTGYQLYRLRPGEEHDSNLWTYLETVTASDTDFVSAGPLPEWGYYRWAVSAIYDGERVSAPRLSNTVAYIPNDILTLHVTTNSGDSPAGAIITMTNQDGDPDHVYTLTTPESGIIDHDFWHGTYNITARLNHFNTFSQTGFIYDGTTDTLNIQLTERLAPPINGYGWVTGPHEVTITWTSPYDAGDEFIESFEGGDVPDGWTVVQTSTDDSQAVPAWWTVTAYTNTTIDPVLVPSDGDYHAGLWQSDEPQDEWLLTPEFLCGANTSLSFKSYIYWGSSHNDHYYVKVSIDNGSTWNILWDASDLSPEGWNGYGDPYVVDLSSYAGQQIEVAFHALGPDGLYSPWFIDEVNIATGGRTVHFADSNLARNDSRSTIQNQRNLLGYRIEKNGALLESTYSSTQYTDTNFQESSIYEIWAVYTTGMSDSLVVTISGTSDPETGNAGVNRLLGNSPNPFNPTTTIAYSLAKSEPVSLTVYNLRGQKVATLVNGTQSAGKHTVTWNGTDDNGHSAASGVYFCRMEAGSYSATQKMMMLK